MHSLDSLAENIKNDWNDQEVESISHSQVSLAIRSKTVLIVDDNPDVRAVLCRYVKAMGARVDDAVNGSEAVEKAAHRHFDTILMDLTMPVCDGLSATMKLRREGYSGSIVAVSAHPQVGRVEEYYHLGFDGYLLKPVNKLDLLYTIAFEPRRRHSEKRLM